MLDPFLHHLHFVECIGANATLGMAQVAVAAAALADPETGTTCSPTVVSGGTVANTIPARAQLVIDSRAPTVAEQRRVDGALRALRPTLAGTQITIEGGAHGMINWDKLAPNYKQQVVAWLQRTLRIKAES